MTESISFEYREGDDVVLVTISETLSGSELRNPLMASCNILREKPGASYIIDIPEGFTVNEEDLEWIDQHFIPLVKRSCAGRIILILPEGDERREKCETRFGSQIGFFFAEDYENAIKVLSDTDIREEDEKSIKIAGKTKRQWRDHFSFIWFKYSVFLIAVAIVVLLLFGVFGRTKNDIIIYSFGYFDLDETYMTELMINEGYKVPYFPEAVTVMPNQEGKKATGHEFESVSAYFMAVPDVIVSDGITYPYYYSSFGVFPESYKKIWDSLSEEAKKHVELVYMSAADAEEFSRRYNAWAGKGDPEIEAQLEENDDTTKVVIGLRLNDLAACEKLGYKSGWEKSDSRLIFSLYAKCADPEKSEKAIAAIINSVY